MQTRPLECAEKWILVEKWTQIEIAHDQINQHLINNNNDTFASRNAFFIQTHKHKQHRAFLMWSHSLLRQIVVVLFHESMLA